MIPRYQDRIAEFGKAKTHGKTGDRRNVFRFLLQKPANVPSVPGFQSVFSRFSALGRLI
jgi:hypothetical protein